MRMHFFSAIIFYKKIKTVE